VENVTEGGACPEKDFELGGGLGGSIESDLSRVERVDVVVRVEEVDVRVTEGMVESGGGGGVVLGDEERLLEEDLEERLIRPSMVFMTRRVKGRAWKGRETGGIYMDFSFCEPPAKGLECQRLIRGVF